MQLNYQRYCFVEKNASSLPFAGRRFKIKPRGILFASEWKWSTCDPHGTWRVEPEATRSFVRVFNSFQGKAQDEQEFAVTFVIVLVYAELITQITRSVRVSKPWITHVTIMKIVVPYKYNDSSKKKERNLWHTITYVIWDQKDIDLAKSIWKIWNDFSWLSLKIINLIGNLWIILNFPIWQRFFSHVSQCNIPY